MSDPFVQFPVAVVQASPVLFDRCRTIDKIEALVAAAAADGARLVLLPEAFVPGYPRGFGFGAVIGSRSDAGRDLWARYWEASIDIPGPDSDRLAAIAAEHDVFLAVGVVEREGALSGGTLYCTMAYYGPTGELGKHRKLKPTGSERLVWGEGDGSTLSTFETPAGVVGGLICWENYMPLARTAMYAKGVQIYLAPTADCRDAWQSTLRHIAVEGRCFVLGCNQFVARDAYPDDLLDSAEGRELPDVVCAGGSVIVSPFGEVLAGPLWSAEGTLRADLDMRQIARARYDFDPVGHYARHDIFRLTVDETPRAATTEPE